jgi:hypothetical protein
VKRRERIRRRAKLQEPFELAQGAEEFEGGVTFEDEKEALLVGDRAIFAVDELGDVALFFHLDAHPLAVARLTRFLARGALRPARGPPLDDDDRTDPPA